MFVLISNIYVYAHVPTGAGTSKGGKKGKKGIVDASNASIVSPIVPPSPGAEKGDSRTNTRISMKDKKSW